MIRPSDGWSTQRLQIAGRHSRVEPRTQAVASGLWAKLISAVFTLLLAAPSGSHAALMSAQDLLTACSGDAMAKATCDGYLMAATDLVLRREGHRRGNSKTCVPTTVTVDQVREAVLNVGQQGRPIRAPAGLGLVAAAMRLAWPCQGSFDQPGTDRGPWPRRGPPGEPGVPRDQ